MQKCYIMTIGKNRTEAQLFIKNINGTTKFSISKNSRTLGLSRQTFQTPDGGIKHHV